MNDAWIVVTEEKQVAALVAAAKGMGGRVIAAVVGSQALANAAAAASPDEVKWIETTPGTALEAYAAAVSTLVAEGAPRAVVTSLGAEARVLAGAIAAKLGAAVLPGAIKLTADGDKNIVECAHLAGKVIDTIATTAPVVAFYAGDDVTAAEGKPAPIASIPAKGVAEIRIEKTEPAAGAGAGITKAAVVVSVGRGLKKKDDLALIQQLATTLGAEIGCSMPVADDLGWVEKERYVGRSGQHIAPRLYLAVGIQGAPQHMEGVRDAKVVVGINNDPDAPIFKTADYGIVGDLYEVVPALQAALSK